MVKAYNYIFYFILYSYTTSYVFVTDKSKAPFNSTVPFKNPKHRLLYSILVEFMLKYGKQDAFYKTVGIINDYILKSEHEEQRKVSNEELKLLFCTSITSKFGIDTFSIGMLDLLNDFDPDLRSHLHVLCKHGIDKVRLSAAKAYKDCSYLDCILVCSLGYVEIAYVTMLFEMILFQIEHKRRSEYDHFEQIIGNFVGEMKNVWNAIFVSDESNCRYYNITFADILRGGQNYQNAIDGLEACKDRSIHIFCVYTLADMLEGLVIYAKMYLSMTKEETYDNINDIFKKSPGPLEMPDHIDNARKQGFNVTFFPKYCRATSYEYFSVQNTNISEETFLERKKDMISYENAVDRVIMSVTVWLILQDASVTVVRF